MDLHGGKLKIRWFSKNDFLCLHIVNDEQDFIKPFDSAIHIYLVQCMLLGLGE
jgi:hypothetical protein